MEWAGMSGNEIAGPLREGIIYFTGGPRPRVRVAHAYEVPRDTRDPRYAACVNHRTACDCREAELSELINELRGELRLVERAVNTVLAGHVTGSWLDVGEIGCWACQGAAGVCLCSGCQIARAAYIVNQAGVEQ